MAVLTPDAVRVEQGLTINEKIIPDSAVWNKNYGAFKKGQQYKANLFLSGVTGKVKGVTIHNTDRVSISSKTTQAEQYTRATYPNCNMGTVRVHYYVDDVCAWQNLKENEVIDIDMVTAKSIIKAYSALLSAGLKEKLIAPALEFTFGQGTKIEDFEKSI